MTNINKNNLPVLYTIPKWRLYRIQGKSLSYFIPEIDRYVNKQIFRKELAKLGVTDQNWYDRWILGITLDSDRPKCKSSGCNEPATFLGPSPTRGYRMSCSNPAHIKEVQSMNMSESSKSYHLAHPDYGKSRGKTLSDRYRKNPEWSEAARERGKKRYEDESERTKTSTLTKAALTAPGMHEKLSKSQLYSYNLNPSRKDKLSAIGIERYKNESERIRQSEIAKEIASRPGVNEKRSETWKSNSKSKGYIEVIRNNSLNMWMNPSEARLSAPKGHGIKSSAYSKWQDKIVYFDSTWEDEFFHKCEVISKVTYLSRSPFIIRYVNPKDNKVHSYTPDFLLNDRYLIEIKPNYLIHDPVNQAKFHAASIYCSDHNLSYVIITEDYLFHNGSPYYGSLPFKLNDHATTND